MKVRSNSQHNLPTSHNIQAQPTARDPLRESLTKLQKTASKKTIPISIAKGTTIDLEGSKTERKLMKRQSSQKMIRSNSVNKLGSLGQVRNESKERVNVEKAAFSKKKSTVIENMLEKKLAVFKRKQAVY